VARQGDNAQAACIFVQFLLQVIVKIVKENRRFDGSDVPRSVIDHAPIARGDEVESDH